MCLSKMKKKKKKIKDLLLHWPSQKEKKDHSELQINICQLKKTLKKYHP